MRLPCHTKHGKATQPTVFYAPKTFLVSHARVYACTHTNTPTFQTAFFNPSVIPGSKSDMAAASSRECFCIISFGAIGNAGTSYFDTKQGINIATKPTCKRADNPTAVIVKCENAVSPKTKYDYLFKHA